MTLFLKRGFFLLFLTGCLAFPLGAAQETPAVQPAQPLILSLETAMQLAARICANAPIAVRESMRVLKAAAGAAAEADLWRLTNEAFATVARTDDFNEGPRAFIEKRAPEWKGK